VLLADGWHRLDKKTTRLVFRQADQPEIREELSWRNMLMPWLEFSTICKLARRRLCNSLKSSELWDIALSMAASATPRAVRITPEVKRRSKN
jgi:hypothetical protein